MILTVTTKVADILAKPEEPTVISNKDSQLLYGEHFEVEREHGVYVYGHGILDGYKGYVERDQLVKNASAPNALVKARATHLYAEPNFKTRPTVRLSFLSRLHVVAKSENGFTQLENNQWVFTDHIAPLEGFELPDDLAQIATIFLGAPYLYGGRSTFGVDCAGLVQLSMIAKNLPCPPRDSKDQKGAFGTSIDIDAPLQRNDIIYFDGHVGIMMDDSYILNATARHMSTVIEHIDALKENYSTIKNITRL